MYVEYVTLFTLVAMVAMSFHNSMHFVICGFIGGTIGIIMADIGRTLWLANF